MADMSDYSVKKKTELDKVKDDLARLKRHNALVDKHWGVLDEIRYNVSTGVYDVAHEMFQELPEEDRMGLNVAHSKGGLLRPHMRDIVVNGVDKATGWAHFKLSLP